MWQRREKDDLHDFPDVSNLPRGAVLGPAAGTTLELDDRHRGSGWSRYFSGSQTSTSHLVNGQPQISRSGSNASKSTYSMSSIPDDFDSRRPSNSSIGHVRSSQATSSAVFSEILPTPITGNVSHHAENSGFNSITRPAPSVSRIGSAITIDSHFEGVPFWDPDQNKSSKGVKHTNHLWDAPADDDASRIASSIYPHDDQRASAVTVFPSGIRDSDRSVGFDSGSDNESLRAPRAAPRGGQTILFAR